MTQYVQQAVRDARNDPDEGATAELLVGVGGSQTAVCELVEHHGGDVIEELPFDTLHVRLPESALGVVCDSEHVESVEYDESGAVMESGNSARQNR